MSNGSIISKQSLSIEPQELKRFLQGLRSEISEDVDTKLQKGIDKIVLEFELKHRKPQNEYTEKSAISKKSGSPQELPRKEFAIRNSALTDLWENAEVSSIYNACVTLSLLVYFYISVFYYFNVKRLKSDLAVVAWTFSKFHISTSLWIGIHLSIIFLLHPVFRFWSTNRIFVKQKGLYDAMFCFLFILYQTALLVIPLIALIVYNVPPISSFIILLENVRLFMKTYAFVRENITKVLKYKPHQDGDEENSDLYPCPKVGKLVYFLFAPTLVYRDNYPRTSHIRWSFVAWNLLQLIGTVFCKYITYVFFISGTLNKVGIVPIPLTHFFGLMVVSIFTSSLVMFSSFYSTLHCWQNCMAEILRFGDRMFYSDWWNCTSYAKYYRSFNILVHDWLYSYIYRDMYVVWNRSRIGAMLTVFLVSAIIHEYILAVTLKFVFPLLFTFFITFGVVLVFITRKCTSSFWNCFYWFSMFQGYGLLFVFYTLEWYARINCPRIMDSWQDYFIPRSYYCNVVSLSPEYNSWDWLSI